MCIVREGGELKLPPIFFGRSWGCYAQIEIKILTASCVEKNINRISQNERFSFRKSLRN